MVIARLAVVLSVVVLLAPETTTRAAEDRPTPILLELFTSEGCSSCPPADTLLQRFIEMAPRPDVEVIGLGHHVDYWDHQGWRDRFSSAALTTRQQTYGKALRVEAIYTPQMIADGHFQFLGSDAMAGRRAIEQARALRHGVVDVGVQLSPANHVAVTVTVSQLPPIAPRDRADILVAIAEDGLQSNVRAGENRGRTLAHSAVVRRLLTVGEASGAQASARTDLRLDNDWLRDRLKVVAFVQERSSRRVLATGFAALAGVPR